MDLHLIRHADAGPHDQGMPDEERPLTERGHRQARRLARALTALGVHYDALYTSPKRRAAETASPLEALADTVEVDDALAASPTAAYLARLRDLAAAPGGERACIALVGHQPYLGELAAMLLGHKKLATHLHFAKGGLYEIRWPDPGELRLALRPKVLRRVR